MEYKLGELFCGPGGLAYGAKAAGVNNKYGIEYTIKHVWAADYDKDSCKTFRNNICPSSKESVLCKDIRKTDFWDLLKISEVDALSFGFPCNDFSVVGEQKGMNGIYGPLYTYCVEALKSLKPKWFLAENVGGLKNSNEGTALEIILNEFIDAGYKVYPHLYKLEQYGIPQTRHRIFIVGIKDDIAVKFNIPSPEPYIKDVDISSRNAIINPPIQPNSSNHEFTKQSKTVVERLKYIKPGENAFTANMPDYLRLNIKGAKISVIYKRLDPDKPAYTVTGSGGGGTHVYHWEENRALTNRERARLQTFPDSFVFSGSKESVRKQIGMAVPPNGAKMIFNSILNCFAGISYPKIEPNINIALNLDLKMLV